MALFDGLLNDPYAFSFSHATVRANERQFTEISAVSISQDLNEGFVYGTDVHPLKRSVGQMQAGRGQLTFSDLEAARNFYRSLGDQPMLGIFQLDYQLSKTDGTTITIECVACRLTGTSFEHSAGADALGATFPFSFMRLRIDGQDSFLARIIGAIGRALF